MVARWLARQQAGQDVVVAEARRRLHVPQLAHRQKLAELAAGWTTGSLALVRRRCAVITPRLVSGVGAEVVMVVVPLREPGMVGQSNLNGYPALCATCRCLAVTLGRSSPCPTMARSSARTSSAARRQVTAAEALCGRGTIFRFRVDEPVGTSRGAVSLGDVSAETSTRPEGSLQSEQIRLLRSF